MKHTELQKLKLQDKNYLKELKKYNEDVIVRVGRMVLEARISKGMTQKELASRLKTKQSAIARLENGNVNISLKLLDKIAKIFKTKLLSPRFEFMKDIEDEYDDAYVKAKGG